MNTSISHLPGAVLWKGSSRINRKQIVSIATFHSENSKTGDMCQVWILADEGETPTEAIKSGGDAAICGSCLARGDGTGHARWCYVNAGHAPAGVYDGYLRGIYPPVTDEILLRHLMHPDVTTAGANARHVRLGAYGDPAAVPIKVWRKLLRFADGHTGYTHQWRLRKHQAYRTLLMASCETPEDRELAHSLGWRTFRARLHDMPVLPGEIVCPASPEGQYRRTCDTCMACDGYHRPWQSDVVIIGHGNRKVAANFRRALKPVLA